MSQEFQFRSDNWSCDLCTELASQAPDPGKGPALNRREETSEEVTDGHSEERFERKGGFQSRYPLLLLVTGDL
jgi:hypothetical protein